jgi:hypothetical protein
MPSREAPVSEKPASVAGSSSSDEAKIGGITPAVFSLSGRCDVSPWNIRLPTWRLGYWISSCRCARSTNTMKAMTAIATMMMAMIRPVPSAPVRPSSSVPATALGRAATMPAKMISEMPLPMPRAVICSPSHIRNMVPPTSVMTVEIRKNQPGSVTMLLPIPDRPKCRRPARCQQHRAVAGVLVDDLAALLAFFLQLLERGNDRRHQLNDDRGRNVGHDAEREDRHALDGAAGKHVEQAENAAGWPWKACANASG